MAASRRITCLSKKGHFYFRKSTSYYSTSVNIAEKTGQKEIVVPYRIERGPTDILKALASTISKDPTAAHYKYEDDPYFIPVSNITKRSFALSKEAGKKAARYFLEKYPELFKSNESVPHIKYFDPPIKYSENDNLTEETLKECITINDVQNCIDVYSILQDKGVSVSQEVKQDLLDVLCFYNSTPPPPEDYYEERYFQRNDESPGQKWNSKGMAEKLFETMEKDGKAYSSMIAGHSKYGDSERALFLHDEMKSKGLIGTVQGYNCLLSECHRIKEDIESYWELATGLLQQMNMDGLKPDLYTMNALLRLLSKGARWRKSKIFSLRVIAEMRRLNIIPSLGSYYYLLMNFAVSDAGILYEIMNHIQNQEHNIRHPSDVFFFATAMEVCWKSLSDKDVAYNLHKLLEFSNNCKLIGNALSENHYFKCFFRLLCEREDIDRLMELYDKYVPNIYTPEPIVTLSVIQAISFAGAFKYLPKLCSDVLMFEQSERTNILEALLDAAACLKNEEEIQKPLVDMVWNILEKLIDRSTRRKMPFEWTGSMLGNTLKTFMNGDDFEKSWFIMKKIKEDALLIMGSPEKEYLLEFCQMCIESEDYDKMIFCVKYAVNGYYPNFRDDLIKQVDELYKEKQLDAKHMAHINTILNSAETASDEASSESSSSSDETSSRESSSDSSSEEEIEKPKNSDEEIEKPKTES